MFQNETHVVAGFITDATNDFFCGILDIIIDTNDAGVFLSAEERRLGPTDIIGDPVF